jgi:hypothetical protein
VNTKRLPADNCSIDVEGTIQPGGGAKKRSSRKRRDTVLVFDVNQKVPEHVRKSIIEDWLVPFLVEQLVAEYRECLGLSAAGIQGVARTEAAPDNEKVEGNSASISHLNNSQTNSAQLRLFS